MVTQKKLNRILIVEDDLDILSGLQSVLEDAGYTVFTNNSGSDLHQQVLLNQPNLIILDIWLPSGNDGLQLARFLKKDKLTKKIPILMITALRGNKKNISLTQADGFLEKPFGSEELLKMVDHLLA